MWARLAGGDSLAYARRPRAAIRQLGDADLVIFGKELSDSASDQHVFQTARKLGWTMIGFVARIEAIDFAARTIRVRRMTDQGTEIVSGRLPAVISVLKDINEPKYPTFIGIRKAAKAEIPVWSLADLGLSAAAVAPRRRSRASRAAQARGSAEIIEGPAPRESGQAGRRLLGGEDPMSAASLSGSSSMTARRPARPWEALEWPFRWPPAGGGTALVFGDGAQTGAIAQAAFEHGADAVIQAGDASLVRYRFEPYVALLAALVKERAPDVVLAAATIAGRELLAGAAADLDAPLLADVTELALDGGKLRAVRPVLGGNVLRAEAVVGDGPQFVAPRPRAFPVPEPQPGRSGEVITVAPALTRRHSHPDRARRD